jgi:aldose 1-epimerase
MNANIASEKWGTVDGKDVFQYTITNKNGVEVKIINYGGAITSIKVPDRNKVFKNVTLAFDSLDGYLQKGNPCFGCLVGRYANRIGKGKFTINGKTYSLALNNNGNTLHGGLKGYDKVVWDAGALPESNELALTYNSPDGEENFPGNVKIDVAYKLTDDNALVIEYHAVTDEATPINLTNHAYFNLSGGDDATILDHELTIKATCYTEADDTLIPTGKLIPVKDTPLDFTTTKKLGKHINLVQPGYDHNFVLDNENSVLQKIATLYHESSGRVMHVATTQPGVQLYTGNFLDGSLAHTPGGIKYNRYAGLCLETQHYPDSPNKPAFPNSILLPGQPFHHITTYTFDVE